MQFNQTIPLFRIFDVAKAKAFYIDYLGFTADWEFQRDPNTPLYMQVSRGGLTLQLTEHHGDCCPGSAVFVWMAGLDDFHRELHSKPYRYLDPAIEIAPWGAKLMKLTDPFGNRILFNEKQS